MSTTMLPIDCWLATWQGPELTDEEGPVLKLPVPTRRSVFDPGISREVHNTLMAREERLWNRAQFERRNSSGSQLCTSPRTASKSLEDSRLGRTLGHPKAFPVWSRREAHSAGWGGRGVLLGELFARLTGEDDVDLAIELLSPFKTEGGLCPMSERRTLVK